MNHLQTQYDVSTLRHTKKKIEYGKERKKFAFKFIYGFSIIFILFCVLNFENYCGSKKNILNNSNNHSTTQLLCSPIIHSIFFLPFSLFPFFLSFFFVHLEFCEEEKSFLEGFFSFKSSLVESLRKFRMDFIQFLPFYNLN